MKSIIKFATSQIELSISYDEHYIHAICKTKLADNIIFADNLKRTFTSRIFNSKEMGALAEVAGDENSGEGSRTFVFQNEGHTLGNALKTIISRYPDVDFCGYTIPHPTENKMHFRIQSNHNRAIDILKRGLDDLESLCDHTINTFESEVNSFIDKNETVVI